MAVVEDVQLFKDEMVVAECLDASLAYRMCKACQKHNKSCNLDMKASYLQLRLKPSFLMSNSRISEPIISQTARLIFLESLKPHTESLRFRDYLGVQTVFYDCT